MNALPDSRLAREITRYVRGMANDSASDMLFQHSARVYWWGALLGERLGLAFDPELLYAAAMFHDIGITPHYHGSRQRFEVDGANAARDFLRGHGIVEQDIDKVWLAIALHTTPGIPEFLEPEVALVTAGVEYDVLGIGYEDVSEADRAEVIALHPRPDFKRRILDAFTDGIRRKPDTTFGNVKADVLEHFVPGFERGDFVRTILDSPWGE
jgi:HD superfamily phosphodiesterase